MVENSKYICPSFKFSCAENRKHFSDVASGKEYSKLPGMDEIDEEQPDFNTIGGGTNPYESNNPMGEFDAI